MYWTGQALKDGAPPPQPDLQPREGKQADTDNSWAVGIAIILAFGLVRLLMDTLF